MHVSAIAGSSPATVPAAAGTSADTAAPDSPPVPVAFRSLGWRELRENVAADHSRYGIGGARIFDTVPELPPVAAVTDGRRLVLRAVARDAKCSRRSHYVSRDAMRISAGPGVPVAVQLGGDGASSSFPPVADLVPTSDKLRGCALVTVNAEYLREVVAALGRVDSVTIAVPLPAKGEHFTRKPVAFYGHAEHYDPATGPEIVPPKGKGSRSRLARAFTRRPVPAVGLLMPIEGDAETLNACAAVGAALVKPTTIPGALDPLRSA